MGKCCRMLFNSYNPKTTDKPVCHYTMELIVINVAATGISAICIIKHLCIQAFPRIISDIKYFYRKETKISFLIFLDIANDAKKEGDMCFI